MNTPEVLTVKEFALRLKISLACAYQLISEHKIAHVRIGCGRGAIRILEQDFNVFLAACKVQPPGLTTVPKLKHLKLPEWPSERPA